MTEPLEFEVELDAPPEAVWRVLAEPELRNAWLAPGALEVEVIACDPPRELRLSWRKEGAFDSEVRFTVTPSGNGSRLRILHIGLPANDDQPLQTLMRAA